MFIYLIFGCAGSLLPCGLFFSRGEQGLPSRWGVWAFHCCGFSCGGTQAVRGEDLGSCGSRALEHWLNSCGTQA